MHRGDEAPNLLRFGLDPENVSLELTGGDEAEESWRVVTPVLEAWTKDTVPLQDYPAGSDGPAR